MSSCRCCRSSAWTSPSLRNRLAESLSRLPHAYGSDARLSRDLTKVMDEADEARQNLSDEYLSTEHLLLAMADRVGVGREDLLGALQQVRGSHRVTSRTPRASTRRSSATAVT